MATVETVRGQVEVGDLDPTLMHEHVFVLSTEHVQNYGDGAWWDEEAQVAGAVTSLRALRSKGITTIVDTGVPITVHTSGPAQTGRLAVDLFRKDGADLAKVVIGHAGDSNDLDYLMEVADSGATLGMDRFGLDVFNSTADRVRTIAALAARGYADRMVLAHDANCFIDWFGADHDTIRSATAPNWHYTHISDDVLPALREAGVSDAQIEQMLVGNPGRYFSGRAS